VVATVVVLALAVLLVWQGKEWQQRRQDDDRRAAALDVAEQQVLDLTTITGETVKKKLSAMRDRVTGDFAGELEQFADLFADAVRKSKVNARGEVEGSAIQSLDNKDAVVLVASSAAISNAEQKRPSVRTYRLRVNLHWVENEWLVSGMEFVP